MARSRPTAQDHEAVVMDVGDPGHRVADRALESETGTTLAMDDPGDETTMAPVSMDVDGPQAPAGADQRDDGRGPRGWIVPALVTVMVAAAGLAAWTFSGDERVDEGWEAPTEPVTEQWSMSGASDGYTPVALVDDDLVVQRPLRRGRGTGNGLGGDGTGLVLERRDGRTGEVEWSVPQDPSDLVVMVDGERPVSPGFFAQGEVSRLVAVSAATGEELWDQDANEESWAGVLPSGQLWVLGDRGCGLVHPPTGRFLFTVGAPDSLCQPAGDGLLWENGDEWVLADASGEVVGRVPTDRRETAWPIVVDDTVVRLDGRDLVASDAAGVEQWRTGLEQGPWWWMSAFGDDEMVVTGEARTVVVDRADGRIVGRAPGQPQPFVTEEGRLRLLLDRSRMSEGEAAGVWSRSPDAATFALLDADGEVLGTTDIVVTGWAAVTPQGVLLPHGPDDDRRLTLFHPDDLSERWHVPLDLRQGEIAASNRDLVVVSGLRDGDRRLVVFAPER